jgi:hypothetical protein
MGSILSKSFGHPLIPKSGKVVLEIPVDKYHILAKILFGNVSLIYRLAIPQIIKSELVRDVRTARTIIESSEREVKK